MRIIYSFLSVLFLTALSSCKVEPEPINYGQDACHYCKMNIVDNQHASEFVTSKGKVYKFDAIECMVNQMKTFEEAPIELLLVCDYSQPGELCDANSATFLISNKIASPMGAYLSAFKDQKVAETKQGEKGGELFTWTQLLEKFKEKH